MKLVIFNRWGNWSREIPEPKVMQSSRRQSRDLNPRGLVWCALCWQRSGCLQCGRRGGFRLAFQDPDCAWILALVAAAPGARPAVICEDLASCSGRSRPTSSSSWTWRFPARPGLASVSAAVILVEQARGDWKSMWILWVYGFFKMYKCWFIIISAGWKWSSKNFMDIFTWKFSN